MRALVVLLLLVGCGNAEAKPKTHSITISTATVGRYDWCYHAPAWGAVKRELERVTGGKVKVYLNPPIQFDDERPDLNNLDAFWSGALGDYWQSRIPGTWGIRAAVLPPLVTPGGLMYGGMTLKRGVRGGWFYINGDSIAPERDTYSALHELAHVIGGCQDQCRPGVPSVMCWSDVAFYKANPDAIHYDGACERRIRKSLGLRYGKTLKIGRGCYGR